MAARGYVHSALAFPRVLSGGSDKVADKVATVLSPPRRHIQRRLLAFPKLSRAQADRSTVSVRSMATSLPNALTRGPKTSKLSMEEPRQLNSTYEEAVTALNSLQSNAETIRKSMNDRKELRKQTIPSMINYMQRVGLSLDDVDKLSVIHVTGTKGKGSTCAFAESILRQYGYRTGLFSSPHLIEVRERIRINGRPLSRELFSSCFWDVFNKLQATKDEQEDSMPHYFSFLTVMALYVFKREGVDVAVLEVGIGGQYDSTNVVRSPVVCGVSSLDLDHTNLLGHTVEEIAWHKAGIFKKGARGITVTQPDSAMQVILNRSVENECPVSIAAPLTLQELSASQDVKLGIAGQKQLYNAALAVQLCQVWLHARAMGDKRGKKTGAGSEEKGGADDAMVTCLENIPVLKSSDLSQEMIKGLCECRWPGRTQVVCTPGVTYYLDGAHTADSVQQCMEWFIETADREKKLLGGNVRRVLLFNMTGDRPVSCLLKKLKDCGFGMAAFCPNVVSTIASKNIPGLSDQMKSTSDQFNKTVEQEATLKKCRSNRQAWDSLFAQQPNGASVPSAQNSGDVCNGSSANPPCVDDPKNDDGSITNGHNENGVSENRVGFSQLCESDTFPCIASALQWATGREASDLAGAAPVAESKWDVNENVDHVQVLVTGSLHLVGGVLKLLTPHMND